MKKTITDSYALYNADCIDVLQQMPEDSVHLSIYSPPFAGLYHYSSDERDLSNCDDYEQFIEHYGFIVSELNRVTLPGRITAVHCMDVPLSNSGTDAVKDFPGDIIRLHEKHGWRFTGRRMIWKEPLAVRLRTMQKNLAHNALCEDSIDSGVAAGDQLLTFRKAGKNPIPVSHPIGLTYYAGEREIPPRLHKYRGWTGKQTENQFSHWIWRQYADCMWDDIRIDRVLPYKESRESEDEKHVHPLQLDVIERCVELFTNKGEAVFTPFMGVGSEVFIPVLLGRKGIGVELKQSYYNQAVKNVQQAAEGYRDSQENSDLFEDLAEAG